MYKISNYSGKIQNIETGEIFEQDDRLDVFLNFLLYKRNGGKVDSVDFFDFEEIEKKQKRAIEIDLEYTDRIGKLLMKHQNKKTRAEQQGQVYVIPQITLDEVEALEQECNTRILEETGITNYNYRQLNPILAKGIII